MPIGEQKILFRYVVNFNNIIIDNRNKYIMKAIELLAHLKNQVIEMDKFYNSCPHSVKDFVVDNEYSNSQGMMIDKLIQFEFGRSCEIVFSWLYDEESEFYFCTPGQILEKLDEDWHKQNVLCGDGV